MCVCVRACACLCVCVCARACASACAQPAIIPTARSNVGSTEAARRCSAAAPPRITLRACACASCVGSTASRAATVAPLAAWATQLAAAWLPEAGAWPLTSCCCAVAPCMRAPRNVAAAAGGCPDAVPRLLLPPFELIASCPNHSRPSARARRPRHCAPAPPGSAVTHAAPPRASTGSPPRGKRGSMTRILHTSGRISEGPPAHRIGAASPGAARASPGTQRRSHRACRVNPTPLRARSGAARTSPPTRAALLAGEQPVELASIPAHLASSASLAPWMVSGGGKGDDDVTC